MYKLFTYCFILGLLVSSCSSKTYFTSEIRSKVEAKSIDVKELQFYVDNDIELYREVKNDTAKVSSGKIIFSNGKYLQIVTLRANTKGVCTNVYPNRLNISFEDGDNKFLTFGVPKNLSTPTMPYELYFSDAKGTLKNTVLYEGQTYQIKDPKQLPKIQIMKSVVDKKSTKKRNMKGRTVSGKKVAK